MYAKIRTIHLLLGLSTLPFLLMYGISAVQMAHSSWFNLKPRVETRDLQIQPGYSEARSIARELVAKYGLRGELRDIKGLRMRLVIPGTVHDIDYSNASGVAKVKTSVGGFMVMLNRLHHAAGFWHEMPLMKAWAAAAGVVSVALLGIGLTGLYMWFVRGQERVIGAVLLGLNLAFAITVLTLFRVAGP
jgi:hypothetical protein